MINRLRPFYNFLFIKHDTGFFRFWMFMLLPCALSVKVCHVCMWALDFILILVIYAREHEWNRITTEEDYTDA